MNAELTKAISTNINDNQETYDRLYVSLLDGLGTLQILIAVCNNDRQRYEIIERYEKELREEAHFLKVRLSAEELSLKSAIETVLAQETDETRKVTIATVLGAEQLDQKLLPQFCGYLQWTREGLRALSIPIVLWLPENLLPKIAKKAPDFWSWRNGVFIFKGEENGEVNGNVITLQHTSDQTYFSEASSLFSIEQLEDSLAKAIDKWGAENPKVAPFYSQVGIAYVDRLRNGKSVDREQEVIKAEEVLKKAIGLQSEPSTVLADSLNNLALLYYAQGRYEEAELLYQQALQLKQELLGDRHPDVATSFNNLAELYRAQGRYEEAEPLYQKALQLRQELLGDRHPDVASSFNNLALLYSSRGRYEEAEPLYQKALQLRQELLGDRHPSVATSFNNLALLYYAQGRYEEAEPLYQRSLEICETTLGTEHPHTIAVRNNFRDMRGRMSSLKPWETETMPDLKDEISGYEAERGQLETGVDETRSLSRVQQLKHDRLQQELEQLAEEYQAVSAQIAVALDPTVQVRLQRQLEQIESKMEAIEGQLNGFRLAERAETDRSASISKQSHWQVGLEQVEAEELEVDIDQTSAGQNKDGSIQVGLSGVKVGKGKIKINQQQ